LAKLRKAGKPLGEYVNGNIYMGIKTGLNEAFVVDRATKERLIAEHASSAEILKPFLRGRDVKRWYVEFDELYLIKIESSSNKEHLWTGKSDMEAEITFSNAYPSIYKFLSGCREKLEEREAQGKYFWELRPCIYWQEFDNPKIIIPAITDNVSYSSDSQGFISNDKTSICVSNQVDYLLGLLNSKVLWWMIQQTAASRQGGFYEFKPMYVSQLPIPTTTDRTPIETLVSRILTRKRDNPHADVSALEAKIDRLVYQLYGLTAEEIAIVEGK